MVAEVAEVTKHVLVVDDEADIREVIGAYLEREGFAATTSGTVKDGLAALAAEPIDLLVLDVTLPDGTGLDILRAAAERKLPVIMLTARAEEVDRIVGLELGADDYITKPFSPREVVARVRAVMRRTAAAGGDVPAQTSKHLRIGELDIDLGAHEVRVGGQQAALTPSEFRLLACMAERPGQVFTRAQLLDALDDDGSIFERTLDRHVNNLRKKIEPDPQNPVYVLTVYGLGYKIRKP